MVAYVCHGLFSDKLNALDTWVVDRLFELRWNWRPAQSSYQNRVAHLDANFYFSRPQHAQVIRNLTAMKVSAQLVDFIFKDMVSEEEDRPLIDAVKEAGNVYFGLTFESLAKQSGEQNQLPDTADDTYQGSRNWQVVVEGDTGSFYSGVNPEHTYHSLSSSARGFGFIDLKPDGDGILRHLPLLVKYRDTFYPNLAFRTVCDFLGIAPEKIVVKPGRSITLKGAHTGRGSLSRDIIIPIDESGSMTLNIDGFAHDINHYGYGEIFQASENPAKLDQLTKKLAGKIVVLSETAGKSYKIRVAGSQKLLPSGVIQALVIQNILSGSFLSTLSGPAAVTIEIGILIVILLLSLRFSSPVLSLGTLCLATAYLVLAGLFFFYGGVIFQFTRPWLIMICGLGFLLIGMGIENALLFARTERARKIAERELAIGREIQAGFFPTVLPKPEGWELATYFQAAGHVAGDFYDVFTLGKEKKIGIVIADVCDKGVGAALFMALFRSFIRVLSGSARSDGHLEIDNIDTKPEEILRHTIRSINDYISITHERAGMFATIFYGILEPQTGELCYINGGHEPPIIIGAGEVKGVLEPTGPAVGVYPDLAFETGSIILAPRDTLLVYTDGVTDAQNKAGEAFTRKRLTDLTQNSFTTAEDLIAGIKTTLNEHIAGENQFDDITVMALRRRI